jgi:putative aldouronate transport system permease protein
MIEDRGWGSKLFDAFNVAFLVLFAFMCMLPLFHVFAVSLSSRAASSGDFVTLWPIGFNIDNYVEVLESPKFFAALWVSVQRTVIGTALNMALVVLTAYPLSKTAYEFKGRNIFMWLVLFAMLFSGGLIPWYMVIRNLGLLNKLWALILPGALPIWSTILMMNFFRDIPKEIEEAAIIDGASHWRILWNVYLPLSLPALATLTLFAAVGHWNSWFDGMILMTHPEGRPLQTVLRNIVVELDVSDLALDWQELSKVSDRSARAATIFVSTIPILIVYPFLQRYFISGIRLGAVKG